MSQSGSDDTPPPPPPDFIPKLASAVGLFVCPEDGTGATTLSCILESSPLIPSQSADLFPPELGGCLLDSLLDVCLLACWWLVVDEPSNESRVELNGLPCLRRESNVSIFVVLRTKNIPRSFARIIVKLSTIVALFLIVVVIIEEANRFALP